ncbi:META domain-containing protein [Herbiconiux sp. P18]|uniref:META domain-containing protein n=1 Tax=Herbiconiux liangxiaofengii TaxID=3342795 RepID=UPI0035BB3A40
MSSRPVLSLAALSFAVLAIAGCASSPATDSSGAGEAPEPGSSSAAGPASVSGEWRADAPQEAWLTIDEAGAVTGSDGCNWVSGTATFDGDAVTFSLNPSTLRACMGVTVSFSRLGSAVVDGDVMMTRDAAGAEIVELRRQ